jgi:hypothetical protein
MACHGHSPLGWPDRQPAVIIVRPRSICTVSYTCAGLGNQIVGVARARALGQWIRLRSSAGGDRNTWRSKLAPECCGAVKREEIGDDGPKSGLNFSTRGPSPRKVLGEDIAERPTLSRPVLEATEFSAGHAEVLGVDIRARYSTTMFRNGATWSASAASQERKLSGSK